MKKISTSSKKKSQTTVKSSSWYLDTGRRSALGKSAFRRAPKATKHPPNHPTTPTVYILFIGINMLFFSLLVRIFPIRPRSNIFVCSTPATTLCTIPGRTTVLSSHPVHDQSRSQSVVSIFPNCTGFKFAKLWKPPPAQAFTCFIVAAKLTSI